MAIGPLGASPLGATPLGPRLPDAPRLTLQPTTPQLQSDSAGPAADGPAAAASSFSRLLQDAVGSIDTLQKTAGENIQKLATGQSVDMDEVAISVQQAGLSFQMGLQVRNKLIESYQEVMRMQV